MARKKGPGVGTSYTGMLADVCGVLTAARYVAARSVNALMTAAYWRVGRRIVEFEQAGQHRAKYGLRLLDRLGQDLTQRFGRGFSPDNLETMRRFYLSYPERISETASRKLEGGKSETPSRKSGKGAAGGEAGQGFALPWSHYVILVKHVSSNEARAFYEREALRGGWTVRQLDRQVSSLFYERRLCHGTKRGCWLADGRSGREKMWAWRRISRIRSCLSFWG